MNKQLTNFLISLKNSSLTKNEMLSFQNSPVLENVCALLYKEGLIQSYKATTSGLNVYLRYYFDKPLLKNISIISKSSNQRHLSFAEISRLTSKKKIFIISTDIGLLTNNACKIKNKGGVVLFSC